MIFMKESSFKGLKMEKESINIAMVTYIEENLHMIWRMIQIVRLVSEIQLQTIRGGSKMVNIMEEVLWQIVKIGRNFKDSLNKALKMERVI